MFIIIVCLFFVFFNDLEGVVYNAQFNQIKGLGKSLISSVLAAEGSSSEPDQSQLERIGEGPAPFNMKVFLGDESSHAPGQTPEFYGKFGAIIEPLPHLL